LIYGKGTIFSYLGDPDQPKPPSYVNFVGRLTLSLA